MQSAVSSGTRSQMAMNRAVFRLPKSFAPGFDALPCGSSIIITKIDSSNDTPSRRSQ